MTGINFGCVTEINFENEIGINFECVFGINYECAIEINFECEIGVNCAVSHNAMPTNFLTVFLQVQCSSSSSTSASFTCHGRQKGHKENCRKSNTSINELVALLNNRILHHSTSVK